MAEGEGFYSSLTNLQESLGKIRHMTSACPYDCEGETIGEIRDREHVNSGNQFRMGNKRLFVGTDKGFIEVKGGCFINPSIHKSVLFLLFEA